MKKKYPGLYAVAGFLRIFAFVPLVGGIMFSIDGINMLRQADEFRAGVAQVDSISQDSDGGLKIFDAHVHVDTVRTTVILGKEGSHYTDSIFHLMAADTVIYIPVWYKDDGLLTIKRHSYERQYPTDRIKRKLRWIILGLVMPFFVLHAVVVYLKRSGRHEE